MAKIRIKKRNNIITHETGVDLKNKEKFYNIQDQYAQNPSDSTGVINSLLDPNVFNNLGAQGIALGASGVAKQHATEGNYGFAGGLTPEDYMKADPEFMNQLFPNGFDNTFENREKYRQAVMADPERAAQVQGKAGDQGYKLLGADWLQNKKITTPQIGKLSPKDTTLTSPGFSSELAPIPTREVPGDDIKPPENPKENPRLGRYAGMLSNLSGFIPNKGVYADPTTYSSGLLKPQLVDEQTMRANIDAANRSNVGNLANVSGGSGAAQRAGQLGAGTNYMNATGNAFLQANQMNNSAIQQADQFNIGNQTNVAAQNTGILNQFELENKQLENDINASNLARREQAIKGIGAEISDISEQNYRGDILNNIYDYDTKGLYQTPNSIALNQNKAMNSKITRPVLKYGGRISLK